MRGMDRSGTNRSPLDFSLKWESLTLYLMFVFFFFLSFYLRCWRLLIQLVLRVSQCVTCVSCMALESVSTAAEKWGERWLTSSKISNDVDGKPCSRWPRGNRSYVECFQWSSGVKQRSWISIQMKDPMRIILHFIAFCIAFYCQLDLQWENYTMLVFLFYYASVFDFPKYKKLYIALCYGRKYFLPWSIRFSLQKRTNLNEMLLPLWVREAH